MRIAALVQQKLAVLYKLAIVSAALLEEASQHMVNELKAKAEIWLSSLCMLTVYC